MNPYANMTYIEKQEELKKLTAAYHDRITSFNEPLDGIVKIL